MLYRWRELHCALLLCSHLIKPNKLLIIWPGSRTVGSRVCWKFGLISIVTVSCLFSTEIFLIHRIGDTRMCVFMLCKKRSADWSILLITIEETGAVSERESRTDQNYPPPPDPLTQGAQHKCCNPLLSMSHTNKAFTRHHVAHVLPFTWNHCTSLMQLAHRTVTPFWVCVSYTTLQCHWIMPRCVFFLPWQDYLLSRG